MKKFLIFYFLFLTFFFSFFASGFVDSQDGFQYLTVARRLYYDDTFEMPDEQFPKENIHMSVQIGKEGKRYSPSGLGYTLALLPAVAVEDLFLGMAGAEPISAFPLRSDWPVLLFASLTNSVFGASLGVTLYLYLRTYKIKHKTALFLSFASFLATNLWPYTKHVFPHMMFVSFLVSSFYFLRLYSLKQKRLYLLLSGFSYGVVIISYNPTFIFPALPFIVYYLLLTKTKLRLTFRQVKKIVKDGLVLLAGTLPFILLYFWFSWARFGPGTNTGYGEVKSLSFLIPPAYVLVEGIWGVLLSPGRSIFVYSPVLIVIILFWRKLAKKKDELLPEIISFSLLFMVYTYLIGTLIGGVDFLVWHGEASWGPRYMLPIIPFAIILISNIYMQLSKKEKYIIFYSLLVLGIYVQFLGILFPYQIKWAGLQIDAYFNGRNFTVYEYGNEIPRYAPVFTLSKTLARRLYELGDLMDHGDYNLRLYDGYDLPFDLGPTVWREILPYSQLSFENRKDAPVNQLELQIGNHLIDDTYQYPATVDIKINNSSLNTNNVKVDPGESETLVLENLQNLVKPSNRLEMQVEFVGTSSARLEKKQVVFLQDLKINGESQNLQTIDYPYVSKISKNIYDFEYGYWGDIEDDPWALWHMHSGVYEQTFDLWWLRPYHYWDLPKTFFYGLLTINIFGILYFSRKVLDYKIK